MTPRQPQQLLHVGIRSSVVALDARTGEEVWRRALKGVSFVHVARHEDAVFASNRGEIWCLDALTGDVRWHNPMKGFGLGIASMATESGATPEQQALVSVAEQLRRNEQSRQAAGA